MLLEGFQVGSELLGRLILSLDGLAVLSIVFRLPEGFRLERLHESTLETFPGNVI